MHLILLYRKDSSRPHRHATLYFRSLRKPKGTLRNSNKKCKSSEKALIQKSVVLVSSMPPPTPKHTALSSNLSKMKAMLQGDESSLRELADYMELQIDGLIADLFAARRALESKEEALAELEDLVSMQQSEKESLDKNLKSMQVYIKEMEGRLTEAESSRKSEGPIDSTKKAAMKIVAARQLGNILLRDTNASTGQALRKWSNHACAMKSVDQQKFVAEALAKQLEITREKVAILKSHLKHSHSATTTTRRDSSGSRHGHMK